MFDTAAKVTEAKNYGNAMGTYSGISPSGNVGTASGVTFVAHDTSLPTATLHVGSADVVIGGFTPLAVAGVNILKAGRALMLIGLCVWFVRSSSTTVEASAGGVSLAGPGGSNLVGVENVVPGVALAKHLGSASAIVVVILGFAAALVALVDTISQRYGVSVSGIFVSLDLTALGAGVGFLDNFYPVAASFVLVIMRAGLSYVVAPLYLTATGLARVIHV